MYLSKQWRESRIISIIAILTLAIMLMLVVKGNIAINSVGSPQDSHNGFSMVFIPIFYLEAIVIAFWGWLAAGIGVGKNLGDDSGSFLFTRPRRRAWFVWNDWGYAMAQIAIIIVAANLMLGFLLGRIFAIMHSPGAVQLTPESAPIPLSILMTLISIGVLLFAGLIYGFTYLCTILIKRTSGVMLGAGVLFAYAVIRGLLGYYYPSFRLPDLIPNLFAINRHSFSGLSDHLGLSLAIRAAVVLALPVATQAILDRSEI
jgi:hypothetical protein